MESDEELVARVQEGDMLAFETLVKRYQQRLIHFVNRIVRDETTAEEVAQDTFVKTYRAMERIDTQRRFSTYLFAIAKNTAISYLRKRHPEVTLDESISDGGRSSVEETIEKKEERETVNRALASLGKYQKIIRLYYFENLSYKEIAKRLQLPVNTVRTYLRRGKEQLKRILQNG